MKKEYKQRKNNVKPNNVGNKPEAKIKFCCGSEKVSYEDNIMKQCHKGQTGRNEIRKKTVNSIYKKIRCRYCYPKWYNYFYKFPSIPCSPRDGIFKRYHQSHATQDKEEMDAINGDGFDK